MKILGSFMVGTFEQREMLDGGARDLPRDRIMARILARASIGDLLWLKEPFSLITSRAQGKQNVREIVPGNITKATLPKYLAPYIHQLRIQPCSARVLERADSRITLEIMGITEHAVRVLVHFCQIDEFVKARSAA